jgi:allantoin racemase
MIHLRHTKGITNPSRPKAESRFLSDALGCAGLTDLVEPLTQELGVPVIDGVTVAVKLAEGLVSLGLKTSKISSFSFPPNKVLTGAWAALSPAGVGRSGGGT